jgi:hypothetical protein
MMLLCEEWGEIEDIVLKEGLVLFKCGNVREETPEDLHELFRKFGGER